MASIQETVTAILEQYNQTESVNHIKDWEALLDSASTVTPENAGIKSILDNRDHPVDLKKELAKIIDHTVLKPEATADHIRQICQEARNHNFASVCVNPNYVKLCAGELSGTDILIATVVGFPLGAGESSTKAFETGAAIDAGADELDMVLPVGYLKDGNFDYVQKDIGAVVSAADGKTVKVILENCLLTQNEIVTASLIARDAGAHFVKTSTGFNKSGADAGDVALMRKTVGLDLGVKAAGGIRTLDDALKMVTAGASRIGASSSVQIVS